MVFLLFYKHGCNELLPALVLKPLLPNGEYPSNWATGIMHPVHRKAAHKEPDNYRKVTVMPCIGKLFESVAENRLSFKNDVCNDNDPFQAGFKSNSRTTDNIFILCAIIDKQMCLSKIKSIFSKAECHVKWDSSISEILKSEFGVLQGGMLSPKFFTEFLQDISKSFDQSQGIPVDTLLIAYLLFADNLVLFSDSANGLQKQLTALC